MKVKHEKEKTQWPSQKRKAGEQEFTVRSKDTSTWSTGIWIPNEERLRGNRRRVVRQEFAF
jgi:hypothetical protein